MQLIVIALYIHVTSVTGNVFVTWLDQQKQLLLLCLINRT